MIISEILIAALGFLGVLFNISKAFLSMIILSVGNALPDGLTAIAIAR